jgi:hypothetical protein
VCPSGSVPTMTCGSPNNLSVGNDLTSRQGRPRIEAHADPRPVPVSFAATPLQWSWRRRDGEHCSPRSTRCLPTKTKTTHIDLLRPTVLGGGVPSVDWLARTPGRRLSLALTQSLAIKPQRQA